MAVAIDKRIFCVPEVVDVLMKRVRIVGFVTLELSINTLVPLVMISTHSKMIEEVVLALYFASIPLAAEIPESTLMVIDLNCVSFTFNLPAPVILILVSPVLAPIRSIFSKSTKLVTL